MGKAWDPWLKLKKKNFCPFKNFLDPPKIYRQIFEKKFFFHSSDDPRGIDEKLGA